MRALPALATTAKDILPILNLVVTESENLSLYKATIQALIQSPSSADVLDTISKAFAVASRFGDRQVQAEYLCRVAAQKHLRFFQQAKDRINPETVNVIEEILEVDGSN